MGSTKVNKKKDEKKESNSLSKIDDIFAGKGKTKTPSLPKPTKSAKKKAKLDKEGQKGNDVTVVDATSVDVVLPAEAQQKLPKLSAQSKEQQAEEEAFQDSRGTKRRQTEDGLTIYTATELKIGQGGDTEDCPFDCDCCF